MSWGGLGSVELAIYGIYKNREKKRKSVILFFTQLHLVSKKMRFSKIANLLNAPAIHNQKIIVKTFQLPPAVAYRTHTEPLPRQARACFIPSPQRPHRPVRACHPPSSATEHFVIQRFIYKPRKWRISYLDFHPAAIRFKAFHLHPRTIPPPTPRRIIFYLHTPPPTAPSSSFDSSFNMIDLW